MLNVKVLFLRSGKSSQVHHEALDTIHIPDQASAQCSIEMSPQFLFLQHQQGFLKRHLTLRLRDDADVMHVYHHVYVLSCSSYAQLADCLLIGWLACCKVLVNSRNGRGQQVLDVPATA